MPVLPKHIPNGLFPRHVTRGKKNPMESSTKAIQEFNRKLADSPDFYTTILPIRDGLAVAYKK